MTAPLVIATRGSALALWQSRYVQSLLKDRLGLQSELHVIKTTGDRIQDRFLHELGGKGVFVRELEAALLAGKADLAVHSLKDMPVRLPPDLHLASVLPRHASGDLLILHPRLQGNLEKSSKLGLDFFQGLSGDQQIATGSLRRSSLLRSVNSELQVIPLRGNVDSRLQKLASSEWMGILLAEASLQRLELLHSYPCFSLDPEWFVPSPSQGALAIEMKQGHWLASQIHEAFTCPESFFQVSVERRVLALLGGDCNMPCGIHVSNGLARAVVLGQPGRYARVCVVYASENTETCESHLADRIFQELLKANVAQVLSEINLALPKSSLDTQAPS